MLYDTYTETDGYVDVAGQGFLSVFISSIFFKTYGYGPNVKIVRNYWHTVFMMLPHLVLQQVQNNRSNRNRRRAGVGGLHETEEVINRRLDAADGVVMPISGRII